MKLFAQIVNGLKSLTVFKKKLHLRYLTWFRLRLCRSSQCVTGWPLKVLYQKSSFEKWLFYKVARWSCGKIFRKLPLSISFLLKLQGTSLQVYQQFFRAFFRAPSNGCYIPYLANAYQHIISKSLFLCK